MKLKDAAAIVAGGASGLGSATVRRLVAGGASCVVLDLDGKAGAVLAAELGPAVKFVEGNISVDADVQRAVDASAGLPLRLVVNTAFVALPEPVLSAEGKAGDIEKFRKVIEVNLVGTYNVMRLAAQHMAAQPADADGQRGVVVNTSSISAMDGGAPQTAYTVAKAAVAALCLPAARDMASHGIRVMAIAPGSFSTPPVHALPEWYLQNLNAMAIFPQRLGVPDEFASLVVHIFENGFLNGETIRLDGAGRIPARQGVGGPFG